MVVGAFPLFKLGSLAIKQISKPIANALKMTAKTNEFFRKNICMPPAQLYHWSEINIKMRILGLGKAKSVKPLSEQSAVELGAEIIGETFIFTVGVGILVAEYWRQARNEQHKEDKQNDSILELQSQVEELHFVMERQDAKLRELNRRLAYLDHGKQKPVNTLSNEKVTEKNSSQNGKLIVDKSIKENVNDETKRKGWFW
ncbi:optic atrophy 3 protein homolog [Glandiceps talaboti]